MVFDNQTTTILEFTKKLLSLCGHLRVTTYTPARQEHKGCLLEGTSANQVSLEAATDWPSGLPGD